MVAPGGTRLVSSELDPSVAHMRANVVVALGGNVPRSRLRVVLSYSSSSPCPILG